MSRKALRLMGFAEYGGDELFIATLCCGILAYALAVYVHWAVALPVAIPWCIVLWFFRDPNRTGPDDPALLLSPADGTVSDFEELDAPEAMARCGSDTRVVRIGIFLSPFNVHVNRVPCAGQVRKIEYKAGEFLPAYNPQAPNRNESTLLTMVTPEGLALGVKQITGILARRIVCEAKANDSLQRGERYGMIKFGSRTEVYIPLSAAPQWRVKIGDKVVGGETVIASITLPVPVPVEPPSENPGTEPAPPTP